MGMEQGGYIEEYYNGGGGNGDYYEGGGGYYEPVADSFIVDYGALEEYAGGGGEIPYAEYMPGELTPPSFEPYPEYGGGDLYGAYVDFYMNQGMDFYEASALASESAAEGSYQMTTYEQAPPPEPVLLPDIQPYFPLPYVPDYWAGFDFPEGPYYPLPVPPPPPPQQVPGYCPQGTYHPIENPMICVPFPAPPPSGTTQTPRPAPSGPTPAPMPLPRAPRPAPRPPAQPPPTPGGACPVGQWRNPYTGFCESPPYCRSPLVFDAISGRCVPRSGVSPLPAPLPAQPGEIPGALADLKKFPWWVWVALAGLLLLSWDKGEGRRTTVTYRRAT